MEELRNHWYSVIEDLLQCPVCYETPTSTVYQCTNGHHLCASCKLHLQDCPLCKAGFSATRNLFVEQLAGQLPEIMCSLTETAVPEPSWSEGKVGVSTQTEENTINNPCASTQTNCEEVQVAEKPKTKSHIAPKVGKGIYPCKMGSCTIELSHGRIIGHLRYYHKPNFYQFPETNGTFHGDWQLNYQNSIDHDFAFHIKDMGLFFLKIMIDIGGNLRAVVLIVNCVNVSKMFTFKLEIGNGKNAFSHKGPVQSCRVYDQLWMNSCMYIRQDLMHYLTQQQSNFQCSLEIKRKL